MFLHSVTKNVSILMKIFWSQFFSCWQCFHFNKIPQTSGKGGLHYAFLLFWDSFFFLYHYYTSHSKRENWLQWAAAHKDFIRITVFSFTGFNMNIKNVWRPWNLNLLLLTPSQLNSQTPWGGYGKGCVGGFSVFSFSYIFIYFSHRVSSCNIMFIHGIAQYHWCSDGV